MMEILYILSCACKLAFLTLFICVSVMQKIPIPLLTRPENLTKLHIKEYLSRPFPNLIFRLRKNEVW